MTPVPVPYALLAEVTHRCPLHCVYCSNPVELARLESELTTAEWKRVFEQARALGVVQTHISGGEPLLRDDVVELVATATELGIFSQLVTSGVGLSPERVDQLSLAGLNSVQLSVQAATANVSDRIAGRKAWREKAAAAAVVRASGLPFSVNVVLHRHNLDEVGDLIDLALEWGADRLELANAQYYSWALMNRELLLPSREQLARATALYRHRKAEIGNAMEMAWVIPDYYETRPKPCMGGWAQRSLTVSPDGTVLPCPVAGSITSLTFDNIRNRELKWIWEQSPAFNEYRGQEWMPLPCRSCDRRSVDFGGCRCQAFALTGDAARTDPVCDLSPDHARVADVVARANSGNPAPLRGAKYRSLELAPIGGRRGSPAQAAEMKEAPSTTES